MVGPEGSLCSCGNRGCLETVFSACAIEAEAQAVVHRGCDSVLTRLFREQPQLATCRTVFCAAREGDTVAQSIVSRAIFKLGAALAGLLHLFDPEIVIRGGSVTDAGRIRCTRLRGREVPIGEQMVADRSGIVGAAGLMMVRARIAHHWRADFISASTIRSEARAPALCA
ncbi:MAG: glucokinase [Candidatus Solibacter sp.]|nr:glucokinase [Candidatus Solibacter sp.]